MSAATATLDARAWSPTGNDLRRIEQVLASFGLLVVSRDELRELTVLEIAVRAPVDLSPRHEMFLAALRMRWTRQQRAT